MVYAYDLWAQLPVRDIYDTLMMLAQVGAAKDMYEKGLKEVKDFKKEYWNFVTPSTKDQQWFNKNYIQAWNDLVLLADRNGVDLVRSAEGRAMVNNFINTRPTSTFQLVKRTADVGNIFYENLAKLLQAGLYNPELTPFEGGLPEDYDTVNSGTPWNRMSPTPYRDAATFSLPYFSKLLPSTHVENKNGVSYTVKEITEDDLRNIADNAFNDLIKTGQGLLMYSKFLQDTNGDKSLARKMFNDTIVAGNLYKLQHEDDYVTNLNAKLTRDLHRSVAALRASKSSKKGKTDSTSSDPRLFDFKKAAQATTASQIIRNSNSVSLQLGVAGPSDFDPIQHEAWVTEALKDIFKKYQSSPNFYKDYLSAISTKFDSEDLATFFGRLKALDNDNPWFKLEDYDVNGIYAGDDIISQTDGVNIGSTNERDASRKTRILRKKITKYGLNAAKGDGFILGPMMKDGKQHIYAKIKIGRLTSDIDPIGSINKIRMPYTKVYSTTPNIKTYNPDEGDKVPYSEYIQLYDGLYDAIYIDTGISTWGLGSLLLDENLQTMSRSERMNKSLGVGKNKVYSDETYIDHYDNEEDNEDYGELFDF